MGRFSLFFCKAHAHGQIELIRDKRFAFVRIIKVQPNVWVFVCDAANRMGLMGCRKNRRNRNAQVARYIRLGNVGQIALHGR